MAEEFKDPPGSPFAHDLILGDSRVKNLVEELAQWPGPAMASHKNAGQYFHKLVFLADIGLTASDPGMQVIIERILANRDADGIPCLPVNIPPGYGGSGKPENAWALCDAPSTLYALTRFGVRDAQLDSAIARLAGHCRADGFGCTVSPSLGGWRGPGKKSDPCPYASLIMLKLLVQTGGPHEVQINATAAGLLELWEHSRDKHPYIFYMGTDFRKLKLPFVWYDILHVTDVLSQVPACRRDPRLREMFALIKAKEQAGGYTPESVWQAWSDWDFGQKKLPSEWLTYCVRRIERRLQSA